MKKYTASEDTQKTIITMMSALKRQAQREVLDDIREELEKKSYMYDKIISRSYEADNNSLTSGSRRNWDKVREIRDQCVRINKIYWKISSMIFKREIEL